MAADDLPPDTATPKDPPPAHPASGSKATVRILQVTETRGGSVRSSQARLRCEGADDHEYDRGRGGPGPALAFGHLQPVAPGGKECA
jgi:hypothetical protein